MLGDESTHSIAVFPFLKTSGRVSLGGLTFRSTDDLDGLPQDRARSVRELSQMLFLQNNLRIRSATCAVVPPVDLTYSLPQAPALFNIQAVVAYLYASPHEVFGTMFLSTEHASMAVLTPGTVMDSLIQPDFHVEQVGRKPALNADEFGRVRGYDGLYNFRHHFWVAPGSRIYGPEPTLTLNHSQDLAVDIKRARTGGTPGHRLLLELLERVASANSTRVLTALRWFNDASREGNGDEASLVSLAIAFESLLGLPQSEKTDRLVDSISLLLGRIPRLDTWAYQFYRARSSIVHEGQAETLTFVAIDSHKVAGGPVYQSLISYGRRIFRLCLSTLLVGADLAKKAELEDSLVTNEQRFEKVCQILDDSRHDPADRLDRIADLVAALQRYRFLSESGLRLEAMASSVRLGVRALLASGATTEANRSALEARAAAIGAKDELLRLEAIQGLETLLVPGSGDENGRRTETVRMLVEVVWGYAYMHYYWLKRRQESAESK